MSNLLTTKNNTVSKNATTHGIYSSDVVLKWEDASAFDALHEALREEYDPQGASEEEAVFELASLHWKKRRLNVGSQLTFHRQPGASELADASKGGWEGVAEHLKGDADNLRDGVRDMAKAQSEAARILCDMILKCVAQAFDPAEPNADTKNSVDIEKMITLAKEVNIVGSGFVVPVMHAIERGGLTQGADRAYRPDIMEKELKLHAEISRQIDKVIKRLVILREYKRHYSPKSINAK